MSYQEFIESKRQIDTMDGFKPAFMPDVLFDFQQALTDWSVQKGRSAILADCGLGKTPMQLTYAQNVVQHTNGRVLVLTPLAVVSQTIAEGEKFGIECGRTVGKAGITVTNYERLHHFNPSDFDGVVCDESSILKSFDGTTRQNVTDFMRKVRYRLLCTATAAPNDYFEFGTSSEALGYLGYMDMLHKFFKNEQHGKGAASSRSYGKQVEWKLRGYAEEAFWRWVCSWARAIRKPSDIGFSDDRFVLPPISFHEHIVDARSSSPGTLFDVAAVTMDEQREEARRTIPERCERVSELVKGHPSSLVWCQLNQEGDLLEKLIPGSVQVSGSDSDEAKEEKFMAFARGKAKTLITKPKIGAWGLNFQHCSHVTFFPSHSFEQYYQGVRRCYRFGQKNPVTVDIVTTEGGSGILNNLQMKAVRADSAFEKLVSLMNDPVHIDHRRSFDKEMTTPSWL